MSIDDFINYAKNNSEIIPSDETEKKNSWMNAVSEIDTFVGEITSKLRKQNIKHTEYDVMYGGNMGGINGLKFHDKTLYFKPNNHTDATKINVISNEKVVDSFVYDGNELVSDKTGKRINQEMLSEYARYLMD